MATALILVFIAVCFSVTGELFLKQGMNLVGVLSLSTLSVTVPKMIRTGYLYAGLGSIAVGAVFWLAAISRVNLSWAYPMLAMGYVLMLIFSRFILHEQISPIRWGGTLLIVIGVYLVSRS